MSDGFVSPYVGKGKRQGGLIAGVVGLAMNGVIYGATLMCVLWILRSSSIVAWNISWHKIILLVTVINILRMYDRNVYRNN